MQSFLDGAEENVTTFERRANAMLDGFKDEIFSRLDFIAAVTSKCLLVSVEGNNPCPRRIGVEQEDVPLRTTTPSRSQVLRSRFSHFRRAVMDPFRLKKRQPKAQQTTTSKRYRVRFLCAYDGSEADCGPDGFGYIVENEKDWQRWLRKCLPIVQVSLGRRP